MGAPASTRRGAGRDTHDRRIPDQAAGRPWREIRTALNAGVAPAMALADAGYGVDTALRDGITDLGLAYVVGIQSSTSLWPPGKEPLAPKRWSGRGRPTSLVRRDSEHRPVSAKALALALPRKAWRKTTWREGSNTTLASRFAAVRIRPAHRDYNVSAIFGARAEVLAAGALCWTAVSLDVSRCFAAKRVRQS